MKMKTVKRNSDVRKCDRCGTLSRNQLILPERFGGRSICNNCENEILYFLFEYPIPDDEISKNEV